MNVNSVKAEHTRDVTRETAIKQIHMFDTN